MPVISGLGAVTTHGRGADVAWDALEAARPAGRTWRPGESAEEFFAAAIPDDYEPNPAIPRDLVAFLDRGSLFALDAALQALESAGLGPGAGDARRFAIADGLAYRAPGQAVLFVPYGHLVGRVLGARGPAVSTGGADASGMSTLAAAARLIASGDADTVVAGAAQALQEPLLHHLRAQGLASRRPAMPFDQRHGGFAAAEGAAYFIIEEAGHAAARGATPIATIVGVGETFDSATEPLATSDAAEAGRAMQAALAAAGFVQNQVDLIVSCADGRDTIDFAEGYGIKRTFGRHAFHASVTAPAGAFGHALAASGPLAVVSALEAMRRQTTFPIAGFEAAEPDLDLAYVTAARPENIGAALVTCLGLGGTNVSLLLAAPGAGATP